MSEQWWKRNGPRIGAALILAPWLLLGALWLVQIGNLKDAVREREASERRIYCAALKAQGKRQTYNREGCKRD